MICKNCGYDAGDDGVYCPKCGKRLDGKISCPKCKKLIDDSSAFCTYCGTKIGDENVCPSCGTVFKGSFCPKCGTNPAQIPDNFEEHDGESLFSKIESILSPSLILCSLLVLFICSFFIGIKVSTNVKNFNLSEIYVSSSSTIFGYIKDVFESMEYLSEVNDGGVLVSVLMLNAVILLINLVITCTTFIIATIIYSINVGRKKHVKIETLGLISLVSFIVTVCCFFSSAAFLISYTSDGETVKASTALNGSANAGLIVALLIWICVAAIKCVINFKKQPLSVFLTKTILGCVIAIFSIIVLSLLTNKSIALTLSEDYTRSSKSSDVYNVSFSSSFMVLLLGSYIISSSDAISGGIVAGAFAAWFIQIVAIVLVAVIIALTIKSLTSEKNKCGKHLIILSATASVMALAHTIIAATVGSSVLTLLSSEFDAGKVTFGSPIAATVLSIFMLISSIVLSVMTSNKQKENEENFY